MNNQLPNAQHESNGCETFEPLVSALIDGELNESETDAVESHLQNCHACQQLKRSFLILSNTIASQQIYEFEASQSFMEDMAPRNGISAPLPQKVPNEQRRHWSLPWLVPIAIAASLLIWGAISMIPEKTNSVDTASVDSIAQPLADFQMINQQKQRDQQLMLKTMELELRSLRIELDQLDPNVATRDALAKQIEDMMHRVSHFEDRSDL